MKIEVQDALSASVITGLVLAGILLAIPAIVGGQVAPTQLSLSVGIGLIVAAVVALTRWAILPRAQKHTMIDGHKEIYARFERILTEHSGDGLPHEIFTINSFPPEPDIGRSYDEFLARWLRENPRSRFVRAVIHQTTAAWTRRLQEIDVRYGGRNYHEFRYAGPPTVEMFLFDTDVAVLSFASHERDEPPVSSALVLGDPAFLRLLQAYHRYHLQMESNRTRPRGHRRLAASEGSESSGTAAMGAP